MALHTESRRPLPLPITSCSSPSIFTVTNALECLVVLGMREVEVHMIPMRPSFVVHIVLVEDAIHFFGRQFGMRVVGNVLEA